MLSKEQVTLTPHLINLIKIKKFNLTLLLQNLHKLKQQKIKIKDRLNCLKLNNSHLKTKNNRISHKLNNK